MVFLPGVGGGGVGRNSDIFIYIYVGLAHFGGSKFCISIFFWVFRKMNILGGMKFLWIFFGGHHTTGLVLGVISMHFMVFT